MRYICNWSLYKLATRLKAQYSSLPHERQIRSQPFSLHQEANNGKGFLFFYRRASFFGATLRIVQYNNAQLSGMPKDTTCLYFQRKHLRNTILLWQNNHTAGSEQCSFVESKLVNRFPIAAVQLLDWHLLKDSLKHSFSTSVSSCLNQILGKTKLNKTLLAFVRR